MTIYEQATPESPSPRSLFRTFAVALALTVAVVSVGCDSKGGAEEKEPEITTLVISPDSASLAVGEQVDFSVAALTAEGDTVKELGFEWASTDTSVFTVEDGGLATGQNPGSAFCTVKLSDEANVRLITPKIPIGLDSASAVVHVF